MKSLLLAALMLCAMLIAPRPANAETYIGIVSVNYSTNEKTLTVSGNNYNTVFYPEAKATCSGATATMEQVIALFGADSNGWFRLRYDTCTADYGIACFNGNETDLSGKYPLCLAVGTAYVENDNERPNNDEIFRGKGTYTITGTKSISLNGSLTALVEAGNVPAQVCKDTGGFKAFRDVLISSTNEEVTYDFRPCGSEVVKICVDTLNQNKFAPQACITQNKQALESEETEG